jgi:hypothetical protein
MRPTLIFSQNRRKKRPTGNRKAYKRFAAAEYERALERLLLGSSGAASPVRKIDPATGAVVENNPTRTEPPVPKQSQRDSE